MSSFASAVVATLGVSLVSLVGIVFLIRNFWNERLETRLVSFAAGVLLGTTFLELIPEAIHENQSEANVFIAALAAMVVFFFLERVLHAMHHHEGGESHVHHHTSSRYFILAGDGVHNFVDGVAIGAAFLVGPEVGLATTAAVVAHELPHEFGDYAILVRGGYSKRKALLLNLASGLTAVVGAMAVFAFGDFVEAHLAWFLAATAGMFIYIAAANLIPELHHQRVRGPLLYGTPFIVGVLVIALLTAVLLPGH